MLNTGNGKITGANRDAKGVKEWRSGRGCKYKKK
jgi:hypothetical protein